MPELGRDVAIDGSDLPAYANGQRFVSKNGRLRVRFSDPDASWGHRSAISTRKGGGYYGYKVHAAVCTTTGLPVTWQVETAEDAEVPVVPTLLDSVMGRGFGVDTCAMDKGYDAGPVYEARLGHPPGGSASPDAVREGWQGRSPILQARNLDLRRFRHQAWSRQVPLPHG
ncbi:MAG: transposase [Actinobacteria bacterium]|nr:transposase [Actinomycetota bacterium]